MRTTLCEISFNNELIMHCRVFISKQNMRGESKTAERPKERESVRDRALLKMSVGNKIDC
jgi:hypothetical protein